MTTILSRFLIQVSNHEYNSFYIIYSECNKQWISLLQKTKQKKNSTYKQKEYNCENTK